jgi:NAD(P)-dependent dehydrogenase (short-subunit alcohol dehydrogenase family)
MFDYSKMFDLSSRRALVIGGASGIGGASALGLAAHGAEVIVADLNVALAEETVHEIKKGGGKAAAMTIDMRDKANIEAAAQSLGALVVTPSINVRKPLLHLTDDEFDRVVDLNLKGVFRVLRAFAPPMAAQRRGAGRGRDAAHQTDHRDRGLVSRLRRQIDAEAPGGPGRDGRRAR